MVSDDLHLEWKTQGSTWRGRGCTIMAGELPVGRYLPDMTLPI
jgi:hypothetical protein